MPEESKVDFSVAFTGGRFGEELIQSIANTNFRIGNWKILQTDERVSSKEEDLIQSKIIKGISKCNGFSEENLIFFPFGKNYLDELEAFERRLQQSKIDELDICFLSIGEDGHLAGHFHNSRGYKNSIFCFNTNSPKPPRTRLSFKVSWLMKAKKIILVSIGQKKHKELKRLLGRRGLHSQIIKSKDLIIITDLVM